MCGKRINCRALDTKDIKIRLLKLMMRVRDDLKDLAFWRGVLAEFVASLFLILVGCGSWIETTDYPLTIRIALAFGFMYAILIYCLRHVSGGHINPAVSLATAITSRISVARAAVYILAQVLGAVLGAAFLYGVTSEATRGTLGCTFPQQGVGEGQGFGVEFFCTFILVFVTFACFEEHPQHEERRCPGHLIIGLTVAALSCFAVPLTGGSFNPARSFGPALVRGIWTKHWIYWFGTVFGGMLGGALYELAFSKSATLSRLVACLTAARSRERKQTTQTGTQIDGATVAEMQTLKPSDNVNITVNMASVESMPDIQEESSSSEEESNEKTAVRVC